MTVSDASAVPGTRRTDAGSTGRMLRQLGIDTRYVLLGLPLSVASFAVLLVGLTAGVSLVVTVIGLPILAGTLYLARSWADLERLRLPAVLGQPRVRPQYRTPEPDAGAWRRILVPITDGQSWLDLSHGCLRLVVSLTTFVITVTWWAGAVAGSLYWAYDWMIPRGSGEEQLNGLLGLGDSAAARVGVNSAVGLFFLLTLPIVVRGCALAEASFARTLLTGIAEMRNRITVLEEQKRAAASAEAAALYRLERDIHDGPQQRLVRLAMELGRARHQLATDPAAAARTLDEALDQTRDTLAELRALSRGIAPPILVDRGLPSALAALAARAIVPVELSVDDRLGTASGRLDPVLESTAYFVVAEALTNIAKHSQATECQVSLARTAAELVILVTDDGVGGAHLAKGHGLAGISDRVRAAGGVCTVTSPPGGPTEVQARLPGRPSFS